MNTLNRWLYSFGFLGLIAASVWLAVFSTDSDTLRLIACDVGQGDAILAVYGETQILVDGGPNDNVLDCLSEHIPYWDREIELVVLTHPQSDHYKGLTQVFNSYDVKTFLSTSLESSSEGYQVLKKTVGASQAQVISPKRGQAIRLGMIHLDILHPSQEFLLANSESTSSKVLGSSTPRRDPNDFSIVARLRLGEFDALLTGDIGPKVTDEILSKVSVGQVEYIKIPHHGSKNGLTKELLEKARPQIAVISSGKSNRYDHPHQEILDMLSEAGVRVLRTDQEGEVVVATDGKQWWIE